MKRILAFLVSVTLLGAAGYSNAQTKVKLTDLSISADQNVLFQKFGERLVKLSKKIHKARSSDSLTKAQAKAKMAQLKAVREQALGFRKQNNGGDLTRAQADQMNQALDALENSLTP